MCPHADPGPAPPLDAVMAAASDDAVDSLSSSLLPSRAAAGRGSLAPRRLAEPSGPASIAH
uniref:hypothetical protein n=1 Tax=Amaricoccus sp. TaxID=1872485 RepID=UPI002C76CE5B